MFCLNLFCMSYPNQLMSNNISVCTKHFVFAFSLLDFPLEVTGDKIMYMIIRNLMKHKDMESSCLALSSAWWVSMT